MKQSTKPNLLPALPRGLEYRLDLSRTATPRDLRQAPRHRWFYFPHSYSPALVHEVLDVWELPKGSVALDPFVGAGTTLLVCSERGVDCVGLDLSPLAALVASVKSSLHSPDLLRNCIQETCAESRDTGAHEVPAAHSARLEKAFTAQELAKFWTLSQAISRQPKEARDFLTVALLRIACRFSRAVPDGGWFRWRNGPDESHMVVDAFECQADLMLQDLADEGQDNRPGTLEVRIGDARSLDLTSSMIDAIVTSPPYPNRHDYTRIFHVELLLLGLKEQEITALRYRSLRSHVEARPLDDYSTDLDGYVIPHSLQALLRDLSAHTRKRVCQMLQGYFEDMYLSLREGYRVLKPGGRAAFVVGNVRHAGVLVPVDELLQTVGKQVGFDHHGTWVIRLRGNSAQQMGKFGREPLRESVVMFGKPAAAR